VNLLGNASEGKRVRQSKKAVATSSEEERLFLFASLPNPFIP